MAISMLLIPAKQELMEPYMDEKSNTLIQCRDINHVNGENVESQTFITVSEICPKLKSNESFRACVQLCF